MPDSKDNELGTAPAEHTIENQSFHNPALVGSGSILEDGVYGPPLPDPTVVRGLGPDRTSGGRRTNASLMETTGEGTYRDPEQAAASGERRSDDDTDTSSSSGGTDTSSSSGKGTSSSSGKGTSSSSGSSSGGKGR